MPVGSEPTTADFVVCLLAILHITGHITLEVANMCGCDTLMLIVHVATREMRFGCYNRSARERFLPPSTGEVVITRSLRAATSTGYMHGIQ